MQVIVGIGIIGMVYDWIVFENDQCLTFQKRIKATILKPNIKKSKFERCWQIVESYNIL